MAISELLYEAGVLMLVGMIVVFIFLTLLIFATKLLSKFAADPQLQVETTTSSKSSINASEPVVAAITAAIHQYKQNKK